MGMQGIALIQSEKVNLFEPRQPAVGAIVGNLLNLLFIVLPPSRFGVEERENNNL
jgi:hypothetical protein